MGTKRQDVVKGLVEIDKQIEQVAPKFLDAVHRENALRSFGLDIIWGSLANSDVDKFGHFSKYRRNVI